MSFSQDLIDKYAPGSQCIPPMKIWKLPENKEYMFAEICNSGDYFGEKKVDGYFYQFEKTSNGDMYLFSRTTSAVTGILSEKIECVPHIQEALSCIPNGTIIVGEIYYPGKTSKAVTSIMGCLPEKAISRQEKQGYIHFYMHDLLRLGDKDLTSLGALDRYQNLVKLYNEYSLEEYDFLELAEGIMDNLQEYTANLLDAGEEGIVLKKKDAPYTPGRRPAWHTIKIKKMDYIDAICIGFCDATKEYTGKEVETWPYWSIIDPLGNELKTDSSRYGFAGWKPITKGHYYDWKTAIRIGAYDKNGNIKEIGTVASGLTDELREDFSINPDKYLNKVVALQCMERDSKEQTLRHAFFKYFRDDKEPQDCTLDTMF